MGNLKGTQTASSTRLPGSRGRLLGASVATVIALTTVGLNGAPVGAVPTMKGATNAEVTPHSTPGMVPTANKAIGAGMLVLVKKIPGRAKVPAPCYAFYVSRHDNRWGAAVPSAYAWKHRSTCKPWDSDVPMARHIPGRWVWTPGDKGGLDVSSCIATFGKYPAPRAVKIDFCYPW